MGTLASATLDIARELPGWTVAEGEATGGSTTTLIDTGFPWLVDGTNAPADDYYNGGTLWFLSGTNIGLTAMVTDWVRSTKTATFGTTGAVVATVQYAIAPKDWPRFVLRQAVNQALQQVGNVDQRNTALVTVPNQVAYTLPTGVANVKRVEVARSTTAPYGYAIHNHWREIGGALEFFEGFQPGSSGMTLRLTYAAQPARLDSDADALPDMMHPNLIKWLGVVWALRWTLGRTDLAEKSKVQALNDAMMRAERAASIFLSMAEQTPRDHQYSIWAGGSDGGPLDSEVDIARY